VSDFDIYLDTDNELNFTVVIEGAHQADVRSQLIMEGPKGINLCFAGKATGSEVIVDVPSLKAFLREGLYNTRLEVIIDDRVFTPLQMQVNLKPAIKVEAVVRATQKIGVPVVTAAVINQAKPLVETAPAVSDPVKVPSMPAAVVPKPTSTIASSKRSIAAAPSRNMPAKPAVKAHALDNLLDSLEGD
jgi:hypothetical protein